MRRSQTAATEERRVAKISAAGERRHFHFGRSTSAQRQSSRPDRRSSRAVFAFGKLVGRKSVGPRRVRHAARERSAFAKCQSGSDLRRDKRTRSRARRGKTLEIGWPL